MPRMPLNSRTRRPLKGLALRPFPSAGGRWWQGECPAKDTLVCDRENRVATGSAPPPPDSRSGNGEYGMQQGLSDGGDRFYATTDGSSSGSEQPGLGSTPSGRIMQAVELLCRRGPMTYRELGQALDMSRAATWRLVATLRDARWVCIRHGGSIIQLDPRLDEIFATAIFADAEFTEVAAALSEVADLLPVHVDLYAPDRLGNLTLHETSRRLTVSAPIADVPEDMLSLAMLASMTPPQFDRHLAQMQRPGDQQGRPTVAPAARRQVQQFPGYAFGPGDRYMVLSLRGRMGTAAAIQITPKIGSGRHELLTQAFTSLKDRLAGKVELFGKARTSESRA